MLYLACPYSHPNPSIREARSRIANRQRAVASQLVLPHRCDNPLPLVASNNKPTNGMRIIEGEANCGEAARFLLR